MFFISIDCKDCICSHSGVLQKFIHLFLGLLRNYLGKQRISEYLAKTLMLNPTSQQNAVVLLLKMGVGVVKASVPFHE